MKIKKLFPILLIILPYLLITPIILSYFDITIHGSFFGISYLIIALGLFASIFGGSLLYALFTKADPKELAFWNMMVKLIHIPFYIFIFIFGIGVMIAVPILFIIDALLLIMSSAYGVSALIRAARRDQIQTAFLAVNLIGHMIFVVDVVCAVITWKKLRK